MSDARSLPIKAGAFALCVLAGSVAAAFILLAPSGMSAYPLDMLRGLATVLVLIMPVVTVAGLAVALPLDRFVLSELSLPFYLGTAVATGALIAMAIEALLFQVPYWVTGALVLPAAVAGGVSAGLWHVLVRKRKVSTHG